MNNQLMVLAPYWCEDTGTWVFDDEMHSLVKEPFVNGIPEMIEAATKNLDNPKEGFRLLFSADPFPGYQTRLDRVEEEYGGWWYENIEDGKKGWLCPAMFNYFCTAPTSIYFAVDNRSK